MEINEKDLIRAKEIFASLCNMLDTRDWNYKKFEDDLTITCGVQGDDLPMEMYMHVRPAQQIISLHSSMPFKMSKEKLIDGAIATSVANYGLVDGSFDYDISDGTIIFRLTASYRDSVIGADLFEYMLMLSAHIIDKYNDKFLMLSKGAIDINAFIAGDK